MEAKLPPSFVLLYAVALKGLEWTSDQADHSIAILKRDYREVVTKEDAKAYFSIRAQDRLQSNSANGVFVLNNPPNAFD